MDETDTSLWLRMLAGAYTQPHPAFTLNGDCGGDRLWKLTNRSITNDGFVKR